MRASTFERSNWIAALAVFLSVAGFLQAASPASKTNLPLSTPEEQGISSGDLCRLIAAANTAFQSPHGIVIVRHGRVVLQGWWSPYSEGEPHSLYSLSKSFTSTAVGLAQAEGKLSIDDPVLKFFPEKTPIFPSENLRAMRVRDLLRMVTGQRETDISTFPFHSNLDLAQAFLETPVPDKPGTHFVYNTAATYMLSAIVQKVTGQSVLDYLRPRLFEPLGIENPTWEASAQGVSLGGFGLSIRTNDIAKFGQLYLQRGNWLGKQLVPSEWVDQASSLQTSNGSDPKSDWSQGYGFQFWRCRHGFYRGDGAFGQYCIVMPQYDAVVAINSATKDMQAELDTLWDILVPAFHAEPLQPDPEGDARLAGLLGALCLRTQEGSATSSTAGAVSGRTYVLEPNPLGLVSVSLETAQGGTNTVTVTTREGTSRLPCGFGSWSKAMRGSEPVAATGAWTSGDTYSFKLCGYRTPFIDSFDLRFSGDHLILEHEVNVSLDGTPRVRVGGDVKR